MTSVIENADSVRTGIDHHCHCEERSDVAISWYGVGICKILQEIATACGLAMTVQIWGWMRCISVAIIGAGAEIEMKV